MSGSPLALGRGRPDLLALDVDGTLLTSDHALLPSVVAAVGRARRTGVEVVLATSRPPWALWTVLAPLGLLDPAVFIASQGALVGSYSADGALRVIESRPMPIDLARRVVTAALRAGVAPGWCTGQRWLVAAVDDPVRREARIVAFEPQVVDLQQERDAPDKLLLLAPDEHPERLDRIAIPEGLVALRSTPTHLEVTAAGVDKAGALARLCAARGIPRERVAAMGDGHNDLAMLAWAGTAIAPANAVAEVLASADLVTGSNDDGAVAQAIEGLLGRDG